MNNWWHCGLCIPKPSKKLRKSTAISDCHCDFLEVRKPTKRLFCCVRFGKGLLWLQLRLQMCFCPPPGKVPVFPTSTVCKSFRPTSGADTFLYTTVISGSSAAATISVASGLHPLTAILHKFAGMSCSDYAIAAALPSSAHVRTHPGSASSSSGVRFYFSLSIQMRYSSSHIHLVSASFCM